MKGKILNNFSLKILSIICAILLWAVIVNIYDPSTSITVAGVTVNLLNSQSLTDKDYTFDVVDGSKISVYLTGPRSIVSDIKASDIIATADLSKVTAFSDYVDIDVKVSKEGVSSASLEVTPKTTAIKLKIENRVSKTFNIQVQTDGTPGNGCIVSDTKISPTTVKLTGSASSIGNVSAVKAVYDVSGATMNINDQATIRLYDQDGNPIYDNKIELGRSSVDYIATILPSKNIQVKFKSQGDVAPGYKLSGIDYSTNQVTIAGTEDNLKKIDSIEIGGDAINVSNLTADKEFVINVKNYLPSDIILVSDNKVTATARVTALSEKQLSINVDNINLINLPSGYSVSYNNVKEVKVTITGTESIINAITVADLKPNVDASHFAAGLNTAVLNITLPSGANQKEIYKVDINLTDNKNTNGGTSTEQTSTANASTTPAQY